MSTLKKCIMGTITRLFADMYLLTAIVCNTKAELHRMIKISKYSRLLTSDSMSKSQTFHVSNKGKFQSEKCK